MCPQTNLPIFKLKESSVRRRYSDFEWLRAELERESKVRFEVRCREINPGIWIHQNFFLHFPTYPLFFFFKYSVAGGCPTPPWKSPDPTAPLPRRRRDIWWWVHRGAEKGLGTVSEQVGFGFSLFLFLSKCNFKSSKFQSSFSNLYVIIVFYRECYHFSSFSFSGNYLSENQ